MLLLSASSVQYHEPTVGEDTPLLGRSEQSGLKAEAGVDQPSKLDHGDGDDHHGVCVCVCVCVCAVWVGELWAYHLFMLLLLFRCHGVPTG